MQQDLSGSGNSASVCSFAFPMLISFFSVLSVILFGVRMQDEKIMIE